MDQESSTSDAVSSMRQNLQRAVQRDPNNARAHDRLAALLLQEFDRRQTKSENPMGVSQIRDAAYASDFQSKSDLYRWLDVALGPNLKLLQSALYHARRSIQLCPLQGASYLYLSELMFLQNPNPGYGSVLVAQAKQVRPKDVSVLLACGKQFADAGDLDRAFASWRQVFHLDTKSRDKMVAMFASNLPADEFISRFEPSIDDLFYLHDHFLENSKVNSAEEVVRVIEQQLAESLAPAAIGVESLIDAGERLFSLRRFVMAARYFERATELAPFDFNVRWKLGVAAYRNSNYQLAIEHLGWCQERRSDVASIQKMLTSARQRVLSMR